MKYLLRIICILFFLFLLKDCMGLFYLRMTHLSNDDLKWIKDADLNAVFISDSGKIARSKARARYINNKTNPFFISSSGTYEFEANAGYEYVIDYEGTEMPGHFVIFKSLDHDSLDFSAGLNKFFLCLDKYSTRQPLTSQSIQLNGIVFQNCICCDTSNCAYRDWAKSDTTINRIDKFIINKKLGLIYFRFENGEEFFRKLKSK